MLLESREFTVYASHHQFYVEDRDIKGLAEDLWDGDEDELFGETDGIVGIATASYGTVKVRAEVHSTKPTMDLSPWDHVTETGLEIESGTIEVIGCLAQTGEEFTVEPGHYRVRCCHANRAGGVSSGEGPDWYLIQVWPAKSRAAKVLKQWEP